MSTGSELYAQIGERRRLGEKSRRRPRQHSSSRMPREATASASTTATATSTAAAVASHSESRSESARLGRADVLIAPRRAIVVEVALACRWKKEREKERSKESERVLFFFFRRRARKEKRKVSLAAPQFFDSSNRLFSLTYRASSLVSNLAQDDLDLKGVKKKCVYQKETKKKNVSDDDTLSPPPSPSLYPFFPLCLFFSFLTLSFDCPPGFCCCANSSRTRWTTRPTSALLTKCAEPEIS